MSDEKPAAAPAPAPAATPPGDAGASPAPGAALGSATYEIIRQRLQTQGAALRERMGRLDARRQEVFGAIPHKLLQADRILTAHNCIPRDMVQLDNGRFLFGFNVVFGLKKEIDLGDVFAIYHRDEATGTFKEDGLKTLQDPRFVEDFKRVYNVYERTVFSKFSVVGGCLYMVFQVGAGQFDLAVFKWDFNDGHLRYLDGRAESEFRKVGLPAPHEFPWRTPDRESYRYGDHPHVSIEDRVFVECVGGDLTIKVEDNTATGEGIYAEPVEDRYQKVDDAEIAYAILGFLIVLRIRPYKEAAARYFIFNEKLSTVVRVDSLGQSCVRLPEEHGLIFPDGYYLVTGELKLFEGRTQGVGFERVVHAPNGEDSLFVFYHWQTGEYVLLPYRLIEQQVEERITCHGFSLFPNGHLVLFRAEASPQKHHLIQLRQTPFHQAGWEPAGQREAFLYQVGNKDVVRCLAECNEVLTLLRKEPPSPDLYTDLVRRCGAVLDAYPWLAGEDGFQLDAALRQVRDAADQAVEEFAKVRQLQAEAGRRLKAARQQCEERYRLLRRAAFARLEDFVGNLTALRRLRGELMSLKQVRYVDVAAVEQMEQGVAAQVSELSAACVKFLLQPDALEPYRQLAASLLAAVDKVDKVAEGKKVDKAVAEASGELEMLIEIVNSLKIEDVTETTRIIDGVTAVYATLNQVRAALKKRLAGLMAAEGAAQFAAQMKLLGQAAASFLDLCDTPAKCDEYLNRVTVQLEELEGMFAGFDEFTVQLSERRADLYEAFEQRKLALVEQRNRKASALMAAAERILKVIQNRLAGFKTSEEIHTYMVSDLMVAKVREIIGQQRELEDSVKAEDLEGRLKSAQQEAVRLLKDRQELFAGGSNLIQLGRHRFSVNVQPLDLTLVQREDGPQLHLTSTKYFEAITDEAFLATREAWGQEVVAESAQVYRAEYLAWRLLQALEPGAKDRPASAPANMAEVLTWPAARRLELVQECMGTRYQEGYAKGVHDQDGARIFSALLAAHLALELARYHPSARACAMVYWHRFCPEEIRALWAAKLAGFGARNRLFPGDPAQQGYIAGLQQLLVEFVGRTALFARADAALAGEYLFYELSRGRTFVASQEAARLVGAFQQHLVTKGGEGDFAQARAALAAHAASEYELVRDWVRGFLLAQPDLGAYLDEASALLFCGDALPRAVVSAATVQVLDGMRGTHAVIQGSQYRFDYLAFVTRLREHDREAVPRFERYQAARQQLLERERRRLRLEEFKPRVLTSFVRNQLIDQVYLPLVGDNLAKQLGAAGDQKRTDLMGMLLLISPPGYGKTTLVEYLASRLGIVFVKINGPVLGQAVVSLDPEEAPNAAAREEIQKLNLAFEMGDNVMICVDDIQHCNPEFLQKFISLCDAQRKIEGVWRGRPRTYDLRGRKVAVVMAGNPYTESGQKFKLPDMLANRADTYNLGDIIGASADWFKASYLENAATSNPVLAAVANKSQQDIRAFIRMAENGGPEAAEWEGSYAAREIEEILSLMRKLVRVREIVLRVNLEYIQSAAQADEFRTEPPFKLQGSYRNMNRLAEKVVPIMNDQEVLSLVLDHYRSESQTLTTGAEANWLKFKELIQGQTPEEKTRWEEIKRTFKQNQFVRGAGQTDPVGRVVAQLAAFQGGLESLRETLATQLSRPAAPLLDLGPLAQGLEALRGTVAESLARAPGAAPAAGASGELVRELGQGLKTMQQELGQVVRGVHDDELMERVASLSHELEMIHSTMATLKDVATQQRDHLRSAQELLATRARQGTVEFELTQEMLTNEQLFLDRFHQVLSKTQAPAKPGEPPAGGSPPTP